MLNSAILGLSNLCLLLYGGCWRFVRCRRLVYRCEAHIISDNDKQVALKYGDKEFKLELITDPKVHMGRETVYKILNGEIQI